MAKKLEGITSTKKSGDGKFPGRNYGKIVPLGKPNNVKLIGGDEEIPPDDEEQKKKLYKFKPVPRGERERAEKIEATCRECEEVFEVDPIYATSLYICDGCLIEKKKSRGNNRRNIR